MNNSKVNHLSTKNQLGLKPSTAKTNCSDSILNTPLEPVKIVLVRGYLSESCLLLLLYFAQNFGQ